MSEVIKIEPGGTTAVNTMGGATTELDTTIIMELTTMKNDVVIMGENLVKNNLLVTNNYSDSSQNHIMRSELGDRTNEMNGNEGSLFHNPFVGVNQ